VITAMEACKSSNMNFEGARVAVQGFGNVGSVAAELAEQFGAKVVAVSDATGGIYNPDGLPIKGLYDQYSGIDGGIRNFKEADQITNLELLAVDCDILMPCAIQGQITGANAKDVKARLVVEGANGPTTLEADRELADRGVLVVPDILANAGGVVTSYFEWVQDLQNFFWKEIEVNDRLDDIMRYAYMSVHKKMLQYKVDMRTAALIIAVERVAHATTTRGIFP